MTDLRLCQGYLASRLSRNVPNLSRQQTPGAIAVAGCYGIWPRGQGGESESLEVREMRGAMVRSEVLVGAENEARCTSKNQSKFTRRRVMGSHHNSSLRYMLVLVLHETARAKRRGGTSEGSRSQVTLNGSDHLAGLGPFIHIIADYVAGPRNPGGEVWRRVCVVGWLCSFWREWAMAPMMKKNPRIPSMIAKEKETKVVSRETGHRGGNDGASCLIHDGRLTDWGEVDTLIVGILSLEVVVGGIGIGIGFRIRIGGVGVGVCVSACQALECFRGSVHRSVFRCHHRQSAVVGGHTNAKEQHKLAQRVGATWVRRCDDARLTIQRTCQPGRILYQLFTSLVF